MYNQSILIPTFVNPEFNLFYSNYIQLAQKMSQNSFYQNSININFLIQYAVSMDFKNFQSQFLITQFQKNLLDVQLNLKAISQPQQIQVIKKGSEKIQKNSPIESHQIDQQKLNDQSDVEERVQKMESKSKVLTSDESSGKIELEDLNMKENKNIDKKFKKVSKIEKLKELPKVDLIEFAQIRKDFFTRFDIQKRKGSLLSRQVENWNELNKTRRNQKLELRRIKY